MIALLLALAGAQGTTDVRVSRADVAPLLDLEVITSLASRRRDGEGMTFRGSATVLETLGLQRGDVPLTLQGRPVGGPPGMELLYQKLLTDGSIYLPIQRGEGRADVHIRVSGGPRTIPDWWGVDPTPEDWLAFRGIRATRVEMIVPRDVFLTDSRDDGVRLPRLGRFLHAEEGFRVMLRPNGVASALGLREDDVLVRVDGEPIVDLAALIGMHQSLMSSETVELGVRRDGVDRAIHLTLEGRPVPGVLTAEDVLVAERAPGERVRSLAPDALDATGVTATIFRDALGADAGVRVSDIARGSPYARIGLRDGDVVFSVAGTDVADPDVLFVTLVEALSTTEQFTTTVRRRRRALELRMTGDTDTTAVQDALPEH